MINSYKYRETTLLLISLLSKIIGCKKFFYKFDILTKTKKHEHQLLSLIICCSNNTCCWIYLVQSKSFWKHLDERKREEGRINERKRALL